MKKRKEEPEQEKGREGEERVKTKVEGGRKMREERKEKKKKEKRIKHQ